RPPSCQPSEIVRFGIASASPRARCRPTPSVVWPRRWTWPRRWRGSCPTPLRMSTVRSSPSTVGAPPAYSWRSLEQGSGEAAAGHSFRSQTFGQVVGEEDGFGLEEFEKALGSVLLADATRLDSAARRAEPGTLKVHADDARLHSERDLQAALGVGGEHGAGEAVVD